MAKFHYADFPVTSATSPQRTRDVPFSQNFIPPGVGIVEFGFNGTTAGQRLNGIGTQHGHARRRMEYTFGRPKLRMICTSTCCTAKHEIVIGLVCVRTWPSNSEQEK